MKPFAHRRLRRAGLAGLAALCLAAVAWGALPLAASGTPAMLERSAAAPELPPVILAVIPHAIPLATRVVSAGYADHPMSDHPLLQGGRFGYVLLALIATFAVLVVVLFVLSREPPAIAQSPRARASTEPMRASGFGPRGRC